MGLAVVRRSGTHDIDGATVPLRRSAACACSSSESNLVLQLQATAALSAALVPRWYRAGPAGRARVASTAVTVQGYKH